jgi:hypothetical protein
MTRGGGLVSFLNKSHDCLSLQPSSDFENPLIYGGNLHHFPRPHLQCSACGALIPPSVYEAGALMIPLYRGGN